MTITNSTISGNSASYSGGGIANTFDATTSLESTIVADNTAVTGTPDIFNDKYEGTVTASHSLIKNGTITNDLGNNITGQDPLLDPQGLQDNGGPTKTIALQRNSPAINAGSNPLGLTTDQRGKARTIGGGTDIGAYEVEPPEKTAYSFEGSGTTVEDISPNNHTLTLVNGASRTSGVERSGSQLNLDGDNDYGEIDTLETGAGFTFAANVNYDSFNHWSRVFDFADGAANNNILLANHTNTRNATLEVYGSNEDSGGKLTIPNFWEANTWIHVTATISETGQLSLYKNGELAGALDSSVIPTTKVRNNNYIGRSNRSNDGYFDGQIDDVVVVNEALNPNQIQNLYHNSQIGIENRFSTADKALSFDGTDDYVQIDHSVAESFTLEAWIKTSDPVNRSGQSQFYQGNGLIYADVRSLYNDFGVSILNNKVVFGIGVPSEGRDRTIASTSNVATGEWVHVAATRDEVTGTIKVFVNGTEEGSLNTGNTNALNASSSILLGGNTIDGRYFHGQIDEVRLWDEVLTAEQIQANYNQGLSGFESNLVSYYDFNNVIGNHVYDLSSSNNTGTLFNGSTITDGVFA